MSRERIVSQNQNLAVAMEASRAEEERRKYEIQRICDEAPELIQLEKALKLAYLNKERHLQAQEKLVLSQLESERMAAMEAAMEAARLEAMKSEAGKEERKRLLAEKQRSVLERQMEEREELRKAEERQTELDRRNVAEIMKRIEEEDSLDMLKRKDMQRKTAKMVRDFEEQRKAEVAMRKAAMKEEEEKIRAYNKSLDARNEGVAAKKALKKEEDDRIFRQIVAETQRKQAEEDEFTQLRDMLWEEELEAKRAAEARERRERQERLKTEMVVANRGIMSHKEEARRKEAEAEARMVVAMRRKFAEDEARERAEERSRYEAKQRHMLLIEEQKRLRRDRDVAERTAELARLEEEERREEYRLKVVAEARKRLMAEHAAKLRDFIHGGIFKDREEYEHFIQLAEAEI